MKFYNLKRIKNLFDTDFYLTLNPDITDKTQDSWSHWISYGRFESRTVNPLIDFCLLDQVLPGIAPHHRLSEYLSNKEHWHKSVSTFLPVRLEKSLLSTDSFLSPIEIVIKEVDKYKKEIISCIQDKYKGKGADSFSKKGMTIDYVNKKLTTGEYE
jgi:hypothetical protein